MVTEIDRQNDERELYAANVQVALVTARDIADRIIPTKGKEIVTKYRNNISFLEFIGAGITIFPVHPPEIMGVHVQERSKSRIARLWSFFDDYDGISKPKNLAYVPIDDNIVYMPGTEERLQTA